jgi:hypothetical protein
MLMVCEPISLGKIGEMYGFPGVKVKELLPSAFHSIKSLGRRQ